MFKWLNKCIKEADDLDKLTKEVEKLDNKSNYETKENGDIEIRIEVQSSSCLFPYKNYSVIPKSDVISHTENSIVFKDWRSYSNFKSDYIILDNCESIERKENLIRYKEAQIKTYEYSIEDECWKMTRVDVVGTEIVYEKTPLIIFKENWESKYKLIETEEELNEYLSSALDCNTWCRMKLYNKMKELGLGDGFINSFSDLIGNDLKKYHAMIDLANEISDKDTLMYLYTYKFSK